jgi:GTPase Era involved in 16S rRNA processing
VTPLRSRRRTLGLDERLRALDDAVAIADGRVDQELVSAARRVHERAGRRLGLGSEVTVAALAGATGSGKSSLFNAVAGVDLAEVGVTRPTTGEARACVWGEDSADHLLDWLGVTRRHRVDRSDQQLDGLVLLDLPDHDSIELSHRLEVDRLVELVDLFVWVVDPQKYADAALHERYLRPRAGHAPVTVVVLNQVDRLDPSARLECASDLRRLLREDGLERVPVITTSAVSSVGLDDLREVLAERVAERRAAAERLAADVDAIVESLEVYCGDGSGARVLERTDRARLADALGDAAGVGVVGDAVRRGHRREAGLETGWPFTRWLRRLRPHPLARLHLGSANPGGGRTSIAPATPVQRARVETVLLRTAQSLTAGLPEPWPARGRQIAAGLEGQLLAALDRTLAQSDVGGSRRPLWWGIVRSLQTLLAVAAVVGFLWLGLLFALEWLHVPRPPLPEVERVPVPTLLLIGGIVAGLVLAAVSGQFARVGALRRQRAAERRLHERIAEVAEDLVIKPLQAEVGAHDDLCRALRRAARDVSPPRR